MTTDTFNYGEVTDTNNNVIAILYGYTVSEIEDMEQNEIEDLIDDNIL